ncbi:MAG: IgGFc-binding protein [Deltaproteobacteria bacterium]|nr:IgGFc-binding protein [Deltaproteobacteria bacterium]
MRNLPATCLLCLVGLTACSTESNGGIDLDGIKEIPPVVVDYGWGEEVVEDTGPAQTKCVIDDNCPDAAPRCDTSQGICVECVDHGDCGIQYCVNGACEPNLCEPNAMSCVNNMVKTCSGDGMSWVGEFDCDTLVCWQGGCVACKPGLVECTPAQNKVRRCLDDGSAWESIDDCGQDRKCIDGKCMNCIPLTKKCVDSEVHRCDEFGEAWSFLEDCDTENTGRMCYLGICVKLCELNEKFKTNLGCEYWAIDMDQYDDHAPGSAGGDAPFAVVISNTNESFDATVTVSKFTNLVTTVKAPPKTATIINLDPYNIEGSMKGKKSYRIQSNLPIVAYQFNPLENVDVYSNDASLLLPTNALGKKYMVLSWPSIGFNTANQALASNFAVVGTEEEPTAVTIKVSANTLAGTGIPALTKGQTWQTTLEQFEVLNVESQSETEDLTGSWVEADGRVAVFGGHVCATVPVDVAACDHMEEQLPPLSAWGDHYVVSKTWQRGNAPDVIRILAAVNDTHVTVTPAVTTVPVLNAGQYHEFETMKDVEITADKQVLVGQFLVGQDAPGTEHVGCWDLFSGQPCEKVGFGADCTCGGDFFGDTCYKQSDCSPGDANIGDPAFIISVPVQQFREEYVFLVPNKYASNYLNIIAEWGASVTLDGDPIQAGQFTSLPSQQYVSARMPLVEGSHVLSSDKKAGIVVYGWDWYVSYGYPGGMKTETLQVWQ